MSMPAALTPLTRHAILLALDEFQRLGREGFLRKYGYGMARDYFVVHPVSGLACDSKAIVGAAYGLQLCWSTPSGHATRLFDSVQPLKGIGRDIAQP